MDVALGALRDDLNSRVHPSSGPGRDRGWRPGRGQVPPQSRPSPAVAQLRSDRLGVMWTCRRRAAGAWTRRRSGRARPGCRAVWSSACRRVGGGTRVFRPDQGELEEETWLRRVRPRPLANGGLQEVGGGAGGESQGLHRRRNRQARQARGATVSREAARLGRRGPPRTCQAVGSSAGVSHRAWSLLPGLSHPAQAGLGPVGLPSGRLVAGNP